MDTSRGWMVSSALLLLAACVTEPDDRMTDGGARDGGLSPRDAAQGDSRVADAMDATPDAMDAALDAQGRWDASARHDAGRDAGYRADDAGGGGEDAGFSDLDDGGVIDELAMRFPAVTSWSAFEIVHERMASARDGVTTFRVPVRVRCESLALHEWHSIPEGAVTFSADPDRADGALVTTGDVVGEIAIVAVKGTLGGVATLRITAGTAAQVAQGKTSFSTGAEWMLDLAMPTAPASNTKCSTCHAKMSSAGFDIEISPTQIARLSDAKLDRLLTDGTKPADVPFRVLPDEIAFGADIYTSTELYQRFHKRMLTEAERKALILYLRSRMPTGEGCVKHPVSGLCTDVANNPEVEGCSL